MISGCLNRHVTAAISAAAPTQMPMLDRRSVGALKPLKARGFYDSDRTVQPRLACSALGVAAVEQVRRDERDHHEAGRPADALTRRIEG